MLLVPVMIVRIQSNISKNAIWFRMNRIIRRRVAVLGKRFVRSDLTRQTVICSALVGIGDLIAQVYQGVQDVKRVVDMACAGTWLGAWYKE